jgi:hypothetical protein
MHYGEQEARSIRGQTSVREAVELMEEGIDVMPLPLSCRRSRKRCSRVFGRRGDGQPDQTAAALASRRLTMRLAI